MTESVFLPKRDGEHKTYVMQRDKPRALARRQKYEGLCAVYRTVAYRGFREKFQMEFYSCWWEMYLGASIIRQGLPVLPG